MCPSGENKRSAFKFETQLQLLLYLVRVGIIVCASGTGNVLALHGGRDVVMQSAYVHASSSLEHSLGEPRSSPVLGRAQRPASYVHNTQLRHPFAAFY